MLNNDLKRQLKEAKYNYFNRSVNQAHQDIKQAAKIADLISEKYHDNLLSYMVRDMFLKDLKRDQEHLSKMSYTLNDINAIDCFINFKKGII